MGRKNNLKVLMEKKGVNQMDLVRDLKISPTTMGKLYNEKSTRIDFETIDKLCDFFGVTMNDIFMTPEETKARKASC